MAKQSNKTNTNPSCCCLLTPATLAWVKGISVWIGGHWLWPSCSLCAAIVGDRTLHPGHRVYDQKCWLIARVKLWYTAHSVYLSVCTQLVCLSVCQTVGVWQPQWELCLWSQWWRRVEKHWRWWTSHSKAWFSYSWNAVIHATYGRVPLMTLEDKMSTQAGEGPSGKVGGVSQGPFFRVVSAGCEGGWRALYQWKGHLSGLATVKRHSLHCVCETLSRAKFFIPSILSAVSPNRGSVCAFHFSY